MIPRCFTEPVKAISLVSSLSGSAGSGLYFLVRIIMLVFSGLTAGPLVLHHLCIIFWAFSIRSLESCKKVYTNWLCHLHSHRCGNFFFVDPVIGHLPQGTTIVGIVPLPMYCLCLVYLQWSYPCDSQ